VGQSSPIIQASENRARIGRGFENSNRQRKCAHAGLKHQTLGLFCLKARVLFVDHKHPAFTADDAAIFFTLFQRFQRACDAHGASPLFSVSLRVILKGPGERPAEHMDRTYACQTGFGD
jgi:hypothetical protein